MGCTTSHDAFAAAASRARRRATSSSRRHSTASSSRRPPDPAAVCRERAALIRAAADRRFALAAAHAAYFRSLAHVGDALRRFVAAALLPAAGAAEDHAASPVLTLPPSPAKPVATTSTLPPSPTGSSSSTVSPLSHTLSDEDNSDDEDPHPLDHSRRARVRNAPPPPQPARRQQHRHYMRNSAAVPNVGYAEPYAAGSGYAEGETSYGYGHAYPYDGPYGEAVADDDRRPPPTPPPPEPSASPWEFFNPFTPYGYDQFLDDYSSRGNGGGISWNLPTNSSPNYAEMKRMEGIPELEDEAEFEANAVATSNPSTSAVQDQNVKGKTPVPTTTNAGSKDKSPEVNLSKGESFEVKVQSKGSSGAKQSKGPSGANGEAEKPVPRKDPVPSNASSKNNKGGRSDTSSLKGAGSGDIDGGSSTGRKKGVAFDEDAPMVDANGSGGSHSKSVHSAMTVSSESFSPLHNGDRDVMEAIDEVKTRFEDAVSCGDEVAKLLEVWKVPHRSTPKVLRYFSSSLTVSSSYCLPRRQRNSRLPSSTSANGRRNPDLNLSSTLEKLCAWEKKLCQEVKVIVLGRREAEDSV
ncbi:unnamed protein product [Alopecurus aequalis]